MTIQQQNLETIFERRESTVRSYCRSFTKVFGTAGGSHIHSEDGRAYIDFLAGCASLNYGHNDPDMAAALVDHINSGALNHGLDLHTGPKAQFLEAFERSILMPRGLDYKVQFTGPTGTNAVEAALKLAREVTGRQNVVAFTNGFHGVTLGALAVTGNRKNRMGPTQGLSGVSRALYDRYLGPDVDTADILRQMLQDPSSGFDAPAAILLETVQGEGGLNAASPAWLRSIADIARETGALLIVDDIQAGCGRTGSFFSFEEAGIRPDMVTMSKSLSGYGIPFAVLLVSPDVDQWQPGQHNGTFRGNTMAFVTAKVAIDKFWSDNALIEKVASDAVILGETLQGLTTQIPGSRVKGRGMFQGLDVGSGEVASAICARAFDLGLILETSGAHGEVVKVLAPLTTPAGVFREGLSLLSQAVTDIATTRAVAGTGAPLASESLEHQPG